MDRNFYLNLAASGLRMPIGTHLQLHAHTDPDAILLDGARLGGVIAETAQRFHTPLALPLMDLTLEKAALLLACGLPMDEVDRHHFTTAPQTPTVIPLTSRMRATCDALAHLAATGSELVPIGMAIGPFSLMTKLVADPIPPVYLAGAGATAGDEPEVALIERCLALAEQVIHRYVRAQLAAGARAMVICEPAANTVFFSPLQLAENFGIFDRFVTAPMRRLRDLLAAHGADLILHDCGQLTDDMLRRFGELDPAILSLGSSRVLWEDAALLPKDVVLYGNLPTKRFYDRDFPAAEVDRLAQELTARMHAAGHPFILGSECDVLSVPGFEHEILGKVDAFMHCPCAV